MLHYYANECVDDEVYVLRDWEKQEDGDDFLLAFYWNWKPRKLIILVVFGVLGVGGKG